MKASTLVLTANVCLGAWILPVTARAQLFTVPKDQMIELTAQNPFERFPDGRPRVPDALIERARGLSSEEVSRSCPKRASATSTPTASGSSTPARSWSAGRSRWFMPCGRTSTG